MKAQPGSRIDPRDPEPRTEGSKVTERIAAASPRSRARITGVVYLLFFLTAIAGEIFLRQAGISGIQLNASGAAAATANKVLAHEALFQLGFALTLISIACYVALTALFYRLFRPVSRSLALIAAFFSLVGLAIQAFGSLFQLAPLVVLGGSPYLSVFNVKQLQALALLFLNLNAQTGYISLVFDGLWLLLIGYLIFRSTFLPRILGVLMPIAGLCYLTNSFANFLSPEFAAYLVPYILIPGVAEILLAVWLFVMGVNAQRWKEQATHDGATYLLN